MEKVGLVLGKFAPLHKGHQFLIKTALVQCDRVYVLVYDASEVSWIPLHRRANWIRTLYPEAHVIEGHGAPSRTGLDEETIRIQDEYIASVMPEKITHFFSSEKYGEHVAKGLGAVDIRVDQERLTWPVSGTRCRDNPDAMRDFMHPLVYRDCIRKVVFLGGESTGKSTLAAHMAELHGTSFCPEYGREFWVQHNEGGHLSGDQLVTLAKEHIAREEEAIDRARNGIVFIDTNALTTLLFCRYYGETVPDELQRLARDCADRYDLTIVCDTDIPFVQDGTRISAEARDAFDQTLMRTLASRGIPINIVSGSLEKRAQQVNDLLHISRA